MTIIPSILVTSEDEFKQQIQSIQPHVPMIQLDIADGKFVDNTTWAEPDVIKKIVTCDIELHLMVSDPLSELKRWQSTEQVKRILVHYESTDLADIMPTLHAYGFEIGIVLNPDTSTTVLTPFISEIKCVQFMTVVPGKQGQPFESNVLRKIKAFHKKCPDMPISADGGVNAETLPKLIAAGVTRCGPGSAIFGNEKSPKENLENLQQIIHSLK